MDQLTSAERSLRASLAAHTSWANTENPTQRTAAARRSFLARFEDEVDPDRVLPDAERARRAESAKRAYFARLALRSAKARRRGGDGDAAA